jgi:dihydrofolate reductase
MTFSRQIGIIAAVGYPARRINYCDAEDPPFNHVEPSMNTPNPPHLPACSAFVGISLDGYLAKPDGGLDWMDAPSGQEQTSDTEDDHGYEAFAAGIDTFVWGRKTFEKVMTFDKWHHQGKRVVVLSHRPLDLEPARARGATIEQLAGTPQEVATKLGSGGARHLYIDGGQTIQDFLRTGLLRRLIISRLPVLIGQGIPLFGLLDQDIHLCLVSSRTFPGGMVQSEYQIP